MAKNEMYFINILGVLSNETQTLKISYLSWKTERETVGRSSVFIKPQNLFTHPARGGQMYVSCSK